VRCVVERSGSLAVAGCVVVTDEAPALSVGSPAGTAPGCALVGSISAARSLAKLCDSRPESGTSTYSGSPSHLPRSANAKRDASRNQWYFCVAVSVLQFGASSRMFSASPTVEPPDDGGPMPNTSRPR
jgi:hypothetical protein